MNNELANNKINKRATWFLLIGVILIGSNLRAPLTSIGTVIPFIREDLQISNATAGLITTLPLIAFALFSPFAPKIANRFGMERTIAFSLIMLIIGIIVRSLTGVSFLFTGTLFVGLAIAIGNVLIPAIVKINFPLKVGLMTGIYAVFMNVFGALGSGLTIPVSTISNIGWQGALVIWAGFAFIALLIWLPQLRTKRETVKASVESGEKNQMFRSPVAWAVTLFMGGQSLAFYTLITWLPDILHDYGYRASSAGWIVFFMQFVLIPMTFIIPIFAEKLTNQIGVAVGISLLFLIGFTGLLFDYKALIPVWAILLGIACGSAFSLSMMFFTIRTKNGEEAAKLSGMAQSFGYSLAAFGPVFFGVLHDLSNGWTIPLLFLICISTMVLVAGILAGKARFVSV